MCPLCADMYEFRVGGLSVVLSLGLSTKIKWRFTFSPKMMARELSRR